MVALPKQKMSVDEFLVWSEGTPGRYELYDGQVVVMQSERLGHIRFKDRAKSTLTRALLAAGKESTCEAVADGATVRIDDETAYEPDALVYCGPRLPDDAIEIPTPLVVVEVRSPSTGSMDVNDKFVGYFRVPSLMHYIIINPKKLPVIHHARQADGTILTRLVSLGAVTLDPPGISFDVSQLLE
jgi:Uma2 family endonuclease